jgi:hypothetical protein
MPEALNLNSGQILRKAWESFNDICIHKDASQVQRDDMKKAFFGGAVTVLTTLMTIATGEKDLPDEVGAQIIEEMHIEAMQFAMGLPDNGAGGLMDQIIVPGH